MKIEQLNDVKLKKEIPIKRIDGTDGSFVFTTDIEPPIYSYGDSKKEALINMKEELIFLYNDFKKDGKKSFSKPWLVYLDFFEVE